MKPSEYDVQECTLTPINKTMHEIKFQAENSLAMIASPQFFKPKNYQNKRLCQYHVACRPKYQLTYIEWIKDEFNLQYPVVGENPRVKHCLDFVNVLRGLQLDPKEVKLINGMLCGNQESFKQALSGLPLKIEFKSSTRVTRRGFKINILCAPVPSDSRGMSGLRGMKGERTKCTKVPTATPKVSD